MGLTVSFGQEERQAVVQGAQAGATSTPQLLGITSPQQQQDLKVDRELCHFRQLRVLCHKLQKRMGRAAAGLFCLVRSSPACILLCQLAMHVHPYLQFHHALVEHFQVGGLSFRLGSI